MEDHELTCDCARCVPTQELIEQPTTIGKWTTKVELFLLRKSQETRVLHALQNASEIPGLTIKFGIKAINYEIKERTEVNAVLLGILDRKVNGTSVFSILEFRIVLAAWKVHTWHCPAPAIWSTFLIEVMQEHATDAYCNARHHAIAELIRGPGPRVLSDNVIVRLLLEHKVPAVMETIFEIHPQGIFRSELDYIGFHSKAGPHPKTYRLLSEDDPSAIIKEEMEGPPACIKKEDDGPSAPIEEEKRAPSSYPSSSFGGDDNDRRSDTVETEYPSPKRPYDEEHDVLQYKGTGYKRFRQSGKEQTLNSALLKVEMTVLRARLNSLERSVRGRPSLKPSTQSDLSTEMRFSHIETDIARAEARQDALINAVDDLTKHLRE